MKNALRLFVIVAVVVIVAFTLAGCPNGDDNNNSNGNGDGGQMTITITGIPGWITNPNVLWLSMSSDSASDATNFIPPIVRGANQTTIVDGNATFFMKYGVSGSSNSGKSYNKPGPYYVYFGVDVWKQGGTEDENAFQKTKKLTIQRTLTAGANTIPASDFLPK